MEGNQPKKMFSGGCMDKRHASAHAFRCRGRQVVGGELMEGICIYIHVFVYLCNLYISFNVYIYIYYYVVYIYILLVGSFIEKGD